MLMKTLRTLLINRDFGLLLTGKLVSQLGDGIHYFAMAWLVLDLTGSGTALGTLIILGSVPGLILTPFSGVLADILDRKTIVVVMDILRGFVQLSLGVLWFAGLLNLPLLYVATVLLSVAGSLFGPAITATLPGLVKTEDLTRANARDSFVQSSTGIGGPVVGALLLAVTGYGGVFIINGVSFLISALTELCIRFPRLEARGQPVSRASFFDGFKGGFRFLRKTPALRIIMAGGILLNFMFNPVFAVVFPFLGKEVLGLAAQSYGISQAFLPVGVLLGSLIVGWIAIRIPKLRMMAGGVLVQGIILAGIGFVPLIAVHTSIAVPVLLVSLAGPLLILGTMTVMAAVPLNVMMQEMVPPELRGRVFSLFSGLMNLAVPLGLAAAGLMLDRVPVHTVFFVSGSIVALTAIVVGSSAPLRAFCAGAGRSPAQSSDVNLDPAV